MPESPSRTISSRTVFQTPWLKLEEHQAEKISDGHRFTYTYLSCQFAVMVVALTADGEILLVRQYRYPTQRFSLELPGGGSGGLEPSQAGAKELREEIGYTAGRVEKVGEFVTYCGLSDEICHVVFASDLTPGPQQLEKSEHITVHPTPYVELDRMIADGVLNDGTGLAALSIAHARIREALGLNA